MKLIVQLLLFVFTLVISAIIYTVAGLFSAGFALYDGVKELWVWLVQTWEACKEV